MINPLIELNNINLAVLNFKIQNVNISLYPGEVHIIMGENGSGKSKLMELISGMIPPDSGEIYFEGQLIKPSKTPLSSTNQLIFIQQYSTLIEDLSVAENLYFHKLPYKSKLLHSIDYDKLNKQFRDLIDSLNLPIKTDDTVKNLGLAQKQMIEFCKAYISEAKVVILDEPSAALTPSERKLLYHIVNSIKARGAGIFYITHRIDDVMAIGDRITIIKNGTLAGTKVVTETTEDEIIRLLTGIHIKERYPKIKIPKGNLLLEVCNLGYEDKLSNINLTLREGEILGITGLAGSGRTLLANCLFGATKYQGQVYLHDKLIKLTSPNIAIQNGIAMMPENHFENSIFMEMNTDENIAFPSLRRFAKNKVINYDYMKQSVSDYIRKINIPYFHTQNIQSYNSGSLQKAVFAKWLMSRAKVFILDEPTRGVDIASKIDIYNFITDMAKKKAGIIYISSDVDEIMGICDRVAVLSDNTLTCDIPTHLTTTQELTSLQVCVSNHKPRLEHNY